MIKALHQHYPQPWLVIGSYAAQKDFMMACDEADMIKPIQYMTIEDLLNKVFFAWAPGAIRHTMQTLDCHPAVAVKHLETLRYLSDGMESSDDYLHMLKNLKASLEAAGLIDVLKEPKQFFSRYHVIFLEPHASPHVPILTQRCEALTSVTLWPASNRQDAVRTGAHFEHAHDEINAVLTRIRETQAQGQSLDTVHVYATTAYYAQRFLTESRHYGVPVEVQAGHVLKSYPRIQRFIHQVSTSSEESVLTRFEAALQTVFPQTKQGQAPEYARLLDVCHRYLSEMESSEFHAEYFKTLCQNARVRGPKLQGAVKLYEDPTVMPDSNSVLYLIGAHEGALIRYQNDRNYLSEPLKAKLGMMTTYDVNRQKERQLTDWLAGFKEVHLSYADKSDLEAYHVSPWVSVLSETLGFTTVEPDLNTQVYASVSDHLRCKTDYEDYQNYRFESTTLKALYPTFEASLDAYDTQFKGLSSPTLEAVFPHGLNLSYTALNSFFECQFKYLCQHVLKFEPYESNVSMATGSLFHRLLEKELESPTLSDETVEEYLHELFIELSLSAAQMYALKTQIAYFKEVLATIKAQHTQTLFVLSEVEKRLEFPLQESPRVLFKGVIDKWMTAQINDQTHAILVDYKSGSTTFDPILAYHGMQAQQLYYAYILERMDHTIETVGFYEQSLMPSKPFKEGTQTFEKQFQDLLRWQGYSVDDASVLSVIDPNYAQSSLIKSLSLTKDQTYAQHAKIFTKDAKKTAFQRIETLLKEATLAIQAGDFRINPWFESVDHSIACTYCAYHDVCFKKPEQYRIMKDKRSIFETEETP